MSVSERTSPLIIILDKGDNALDNDMQKGGSNGWLAGVGLFASIRLNLNRWGRRVNDRYHRWLD